MLNRVMSAGYAMKVEQKLIVIPFASMAANARLAVRLYSESKVFKSGILHTQKV